jgi:hypothetical protein
MLTLTVVKDENAAQDSVKSSLLRKASSLSYYEENHSMPPSTMPPDATVHTGSDLLKTSYVRINDDTSFPLPSNHNGKLNRPFYGASKSTQVIEGSEVFNPVTNSLN